MRACAKQSRTACATLDCFACARNDGDMHPHSRGAKRVRVVQVSDPRKKRAQERPGADRTHGPRATKSTRQNHRWRPNIPWAQTVVATPVRFLFIDDSNWSSASAGVLKPSVFRGRPLRAAATAEMSSAL